MNTIQNNTYKTKDIFEASVLYSQNLRLLQLEPDGRYFWFVFADRPTCEKLSMDYWSQKAQVNAKQFVNSLKTLKDLVFSQKGGITS